MKELFIALGLFLFIEGILYALFPSKMKNMIKKIELVKNNQLRAFGLFLFIEGILYAIFPSKMKNMIKKIELIQNSQLRTGGLVFAIIGFVIIYYVKN